MTSRWVQVFLPCYRTPLVLRPVQYMEREGSEA